MISFIYTAYQILSLLYETVPAFKNTWIECLGDLARYRMAIEDEDVSARENWTNVSRFWYIKAVNNTPEVGRLYHHLAILARPNALQQLYFFGRSLISIQVFASARESILTLFNIFLGQSEAPSHISQLDGYYVKAHALLFMKEQPEEFMKCQMGYLQLLDQHIGRAGAKWREQGAWVIISLMTALFDYGNDSPLRRAFILGFHRVAQQVRVGPDGNPSQESNAQQSEKADNDTKIQDTESLSTVDEKTQRAWDNALNFAVANSTLVLRRRGDKNVLPFVHILLAFTLALTKTSAADPQAESTRVVTRILQMLPRKELCEFLNTLITSGPVDPLYESDSFIRPQEGEQIPLPEDYLIRGQVWSQDYLSADLFKSSDSENEEKNIEHASTVRMRADRVLNLGYRLAQVYLIAT